MSPKEAGVRTTLSIDDDILAIARALAGERVGTLVQ